MPGQVGYYDSFGEKYAESILSCPEPEYWTTDLAEKGRIYQEIKERVNIQQDIINHYFKKESAVLDIGCGFGRQAIWLARKGYEVVGIDTSPVFIKIAKALFDKNKLKAEFICTDLSSSNFQKKFRQAIMLDTFEHIPVGKRSDLAASIVNILEPGAILFISVPQVKQRFTSKINNNFRKRITQHLNWFLAREEHPYPIPDLKSIKKIFLPSFTLIESRQENGTSYYILRKK